MTDKEKIIAEIERRIQECKGRKIDSSYYDGLIFAFEEVMDFINSLPEEPVEEYEAEINYWNQRGLSIRLDKNLKDLGFEEGDKVKITIVKENKL